MIGFYSYTVILTYLSLVFAMVGIHLSVIGLYQWSFICLMKPSDYLLFEELECLYQGNIGELIKYRGLC